MILGESFFYDNKVSSTYPSQIHGLMSLANDISFSICNINNLINFCFIVENHIGSGEYHFDSTPRLTPSLHAMIIYIFYLYLHLTNY